MNKKTLKKSAKTNGWLNDYPIIPELDESILAENIANKIKKTYPKLNLFQLSTLERTIFTEILDTLEKHEYVLYRP